MKRRHLLFGVAACLALALAVPALGGPSNPIAENAGLTLSKVNKKAKTALKTANAAQGSANAAQASATNALSVANGKQEKVRWALVSANGTVQAQSGGISADFISSNSYFVDFGSSQVNHGLFVTPLDSAVADTNTQLSTAVCGGTANPGGIVCSQSNDVNHVLVQTTDSAGSAIARGFWIASIQ